LVVLLFVGVLVFGFLLFRSQGRVGQSLAAVEVRLAEASTAAGNLTETTSVIRTELSRAQENLVALQAHTGARQELERQTTESIRRLEAIIAGTHSKGAAGENIIEIVFAQLPADWQVRGFRLGNKIVEFGLRLPNNLILPIDSKWAATALMEQFFSCNNPVERQSLKSQVERVVVDRAKEIRKYIDPSQTVDFGVIAVPDAVYDLCCGIQVELFQSNVVLVSYSMFVPYLLLVFQTALKTTQTIDLQKVNAYLKSTQDSLKALQDELEGRFSRAITMLSNSRDDMRAHISKVSSGLTSLQISSGTVAELEEATHVTET